MAELIVVTGGAYAGKTSVIEALSDRGYETLPEAAYEVIRDLNDVHGVAGQMAWRRANEAEFQRRISETQHARELVARRSASRLVFCDRGLIDGLAYCRLAGVTWARELHDLAASARYAHVFVLATLSTFQPRRDSGRIDTHESSVRVASMLGELYRPRSGQVTHVPETTVDDRVALVLAALRLPPEARAHP